MRAYARQAQDPEMQVWATEIKLRAERIAGAMLDKMQKHPGGRPTENQSHDATSLKKLGITKSQSSRWQEEATVPEPEFEAWLATHKDGAVPTSAGLR